ncbi:hypothetical protein CL42_11045 [Acinetobacter sp. Ver3]|nr:hypothetical protein CL42_11045 [Acinetobacter sp. Ver3]
MSITTHIDVLVAEQIFSIEKILLQFTIFSVNQDWLYQSFWNETTKYFKKILFIYTVVTFLA